MRTLAWRVVRIALAASLLAVLAVRPIGAQAPAGTTNAVLSFINAADGHIEVVRHWHGPGTGEETQVFPWTPYWWDGCLPWQNGALMFLVTSPVGYAPPGLTSSSAYTTQYVAGVAQALRQGVSQAAAATSLLQGQANLQQIAAGMTTPGNPAYEALKLAVGHPNSLANYEDYGYATFLMIKWKMVWTMFGPVPVACADYQYVTVPEGRGIPIVTEAPLVERRFSWPFTKIVGHDLDIITGVFGHGAQSWAESLR